MTLIERDLELGTLHRLLGDALAGRGKLVVVTGAVGVGKTALVRAFTESVNAQDALVLSGTTTYADHGVPLGVLMRMLRDAGSSAAARLDVRRRMDKGLGAVTSDASRARLTAGTPVPAPVVEELRDVVLRMAADTPLVITIDDIHYADPTSLLLLLSIAHRLAASRVLVVLTRRSGLWREQLPLQADLLSQPHCRWMRLGPLSQRGQADLMADRYGTDAARRLTESCHTIARGNPLLVHALLEDNPLPPQGEDGLNLGGAFQRAVTSLLQRVGPEAAGVAQALAVVLEPVPTALLGRLLEAAPERVDEAAESLNAAGLLDGGRFGHPAVRAMVRDAMTPARRAALNGRAALLLHENGAAPELVAGHLLSAAEPADEADPLGGPGLPVSALTEPWAAPTLEEAGEQALAGGRLCTALSLLRLANGLYTDEAARTRISGTLASAEWRVDPTAVDRLLPTLQTQARAGWFDRRQTVRLIGYLLWRGQVDEALDLLGRWAGLAAESSAPERRESAATRLLLSCFAPVVVERAMPGWSAACDRETISAAANRQLRAVAALSAVLTGEAGDDGAAVAEEVLQSARPGRTPREQLLAALAALICDERDDSAAEWCDLFLEQADDIHDTVTEALLIAIRALTHLRRGDLGAAERHARDAFGRLSPDGWGVGIGLPFSILVRANTALGRYEDAATYLGVTVPDGMFETPFGLQYLEARGHYWLAAGQPYAALADFKACGELMRRWKLDASGLVAWRADMALAFVALGDLRLGADLAEKQLRRLRPGPSRTRGVTLRVLALATAESGRRRELLREAADVLERSGDKHELALTLADLGGGHFDGGPGPAVSEGERDVALLAAQGRTNREISEELRITVSAVEQRLMRVYRKLDVRRDGLRPELLDAGQELTVRQSRPTPGETSREC